MSTPTRSRIRLRYAMRGKVRFLSHRDMARVAERGIRRAGIPVAYSEGFSPRPKLHFGLALSTGYESEAEFVDLDLDPDRVGVREPTAVAAALAPCLPSGLEITGAAAVPPGEPSLQDAVTSTAWDAIVVAPEGVRALAALAEGLLSSTTHEIDIVRKGKQVREDLRPLLLALAVRPAETGSTPPPSPQSGDPATERAQLAFELGTKPRSIRPAELLECLGVTESLLVRRTHQWIQRDDRRVEPLGLTEPSSPHAQARAS